MRITSREYCVLTTVDRTRADCGEYASVRALSHLLRDHGPEEVGQILHDLSDKQLVKLDEHGCAAVTEEGAATLKSL